MISTILLLLCAIGCSVGQQLPASYVVTEDSYVSKNSPNTNYGTSPYLSVKRTLGEERALVQFNLDGTQQLFDIVNSPFAPDYYFDCNHWYTILGATLNFQLASVSGCQEGCQLQLYSNVGQFTGSSVTWNCPSDLNLTNNQPDCFSRWDGGGVDLDDDLVGTLSVVDGQTGLVSFDITSLALGLKKPNLNVSFALTMSHHSGQVLLYSSNSNQTAPNVQVQNRQQPIEEQCTRLYQIVQVSGLPPLNVSYLLCENQNGPTDYTKNPLLFNHGMPEYSYLYSNLGQLLANELERPIYLYDWVGTGYSEKPLNLTAFDYSWINQSAVLAGFVEAVNMTQGGSVKLFHYSFEVGTLPGTYFDVTNTDKLMAIITNQESYLNSCPNQFDNTNSGQGFPPPLGVGLCQNETLVPRQFAGGPLNSEWDFWQYCLYTSYNCSCQNFQPLFVDPQYYVEFFSVFDQPPFEVFEILTQVYENSTEDPYCETNRLMLFPMNVPVPVPGEPAIDQFVIESINSFMRTTLVPKLFLYWDSGFFPTANFQIPYAESIFPNVVTSCMGTASAHFSHYVDFYNHFLAISDYVRLIESTN